MRHRHLDEAKDEVIARYRAGESICGLGKAYGVNQTTIRNRLIEWSVARRSRRGTRKRGGPLFACGKDGGYLGTVDRNSRICRIHRGCWEAQHGLIPSGFVVHHIDGDKLNNEVENLGCMAASEHRSLHNPKKNLPQPQNSA